MPAHQRRLAVVGLGYVGLPIALCFAASGARVICYDTDRARVEALLVGNDQNRVVTSAELQNANLIFTSDSDMLAEADFFIIAVPTPLDSVNNPDLRALLSATAIVGKALSRGDIVVYESTVYPGVTEEVCASALQRTSRLVCGHDFTVGYSPERIDPGSADYGFSQIDKIVAAQDQGTLETMEVVYRSVVTGKIHRASSIRLAEAAKLIENAQRDLNIALVNEFAEVCRKVGLDTNDVLALAATKWNFLSVTPGLVGGRCIGVAPYYLSHWAEKAGSPFKAVLVGRTINDRYPRLIAEECERLVRQTVAKATPRIGILGVTYKENVSDVRNSKVLDIIHYLESCGFEVLTCDPLADKVISEREYGLHLIDLESLGSCDAIMVAVPHEIFLQAGWDAVVGALNSENGIVFDVRGRLDRMSRPAGITLWRP